MAVQKQTNIIMKQMIWISILVFLSIVCLPILSSAQVDSTPLNASGLDTTQRAYLAYDQGSAALANKNYLDAISLFKKGLEFNPYYKDCIKKLGEVYFELSNYDEALAYFKQAYQLNKEDIETLQWLAKTKIAMNQVEQAEMYIRETLLLNNRDPLSYEIYGDIYLAQYKYPEAIIQYSEAYYIDPKTVIPLLRIANCHMDRKKFDLANEYLHLARDNDPQNYQVNYEMGRYYYVMGDYENAERHLGLSLQFFRTYKPALELQAHLYFKQKRWDQAAQILQFATTQDRFNPILFYEWAIALENMAVDREGIERALQTYIRGSNLDKGNEIIRWRCEDTAVTSRKLRPDHYLRMRFAKVNEEVGDYYYEKNYQERSLLFYKRSIRLFPTNPETRIKVANIYRLRGQIERYLNELYIIRDINPRQENIDNDIDYYERVVSRLLSRERGIQQYDVEKDLPVYAISNFTQTQENTIHYDLNRTLKDILFTTLILKDNLDVKLITEETVSDELGKAQNMGANYIIKGSVEEIDDFINLTIQIINVKNGIEFRRFSISQTGNDKFINACLDIANRVEKQAPVFGRIIQKWGNRVLVNLGSTQNLAIGDRLYIFPDKNTVDYLMQQRAHLHPTRLAERQIGTIQITRLDEEIAEGELINPGFIDQINVNQYVFPE